MKSIKGLLLGLVAFVALRYAFLYGVRSLVTSASTDKACLVMEGNTTREEDRRTYIVGSIRNTCDRKLDHVTINFKLDRPADSNLGRSEVPVYAYVNDVQPGETRQFKTMFPVARNTIYRYDGMSAY
jgi:hypothetical protein